MKSRINFYSPLFHVFLLLHAGCAAKITHVKFGTYHVYGNCEQCKSKIEAAAFQKRIATATWNEKDGMLSLVYDSMQTNADAILKKIALAGYDNEKFIAPEVAYSKLPACCKYDRQIRSTESQTPVQSAPETISMYTCPMHPEVESDQQGSCPKCGMQLVKKSTSANAQATVKEKESKVQPEHAPDPVSAVYTAYFSLKDALISNNAKSAASAAKTLYEETNSVKMESLKGTQHTAWMKYFTELSYNAEHIKGTPEIEHQREQFSKLSTAMYEVMKAINPGYPVYFDHCPMYNKGKGADWLSKEEKIKNPYYGSQMLTCGSVKDTIR